MSATLEAVLRAAEGRSSAPAVVEAGGTLSYGALLAAVEAPLDGDPDPAAPVVARSATDTLIRVLRQRRRGAIPALGGPAPPSSVPVPPGTAFLRATSGTTGEPRWIAISEGQAARAAQRSAAMMGLEPGDVVVTTPSASTSFGWVAGLLGPILAGATVVVARPEAPREILEVAAGWRPSWIVTTPPLVRALSRLLALDSPPAAPLRILVGSSGYPADAARRLLELGVRVIDRYGASEAGPIAQAEAPLGPLRPGPGVGLASVAGRLEVRSDAVAIGELGGACFDGVFRSEDLVAFEPDGFRLLGRADRVVRRAGRSISLERLEGLLRALPGVAGARVESRPGGLDVELVARVVPEAGARLCAERVLAQLAEQLEPWERPGRLELVARAEATWKW